MIVDIEKIIIKDRIRKDFGDIQELADDIKQNGLINPPVVNKNYELLAGERRLRACKSLGWSQIEIRMMDTRDAEHELNVEISENENRKEFSKAERVDYMKRLLAIEQVKASERMNNPTQKSAEGEARDITAKQFGISHDTMKKEISIVDHKDLLDPADFANWDEGKLSTNKAYQAIKKTLAEKDERIAELESAKSKPSMKDKFYESRIKDLSDTNENLKLKVVELERSEFELKSQIAELEESQLEPEVREVEVVPEDYKAVMEELEKAKALILDQRKIIKQLNTDKDRRIQEHGSNDYSNAKHELQVFRKKYSEVKELSAVFDAIDSILEEG